MNYLFDEPLTIKLYRKALKFKFSHTFALPFKIAMPTTEQLFDIWDFQLHFFGGSGEPKQTYEGSSDENGLTTPKLVDRPIAAKSSFQVLSGKEIGEYRYDSENEDLEIFIPNP